MKVGVNWLGSWKAYSIDELQSLCPKQRMALFKEQFLFKGSLSDDTNSDKVNYFLTFIGDKARELGSAIRWQVDTGANNPMENDTSALYKV